MSTGNLFVFPRAAPLYNGAVKAGSKLYFYRSGTSTAQDTFTDAALTTASSNPVIADSAGAFAKIYLTPGDNYRVTWRDSNDALLTQDDNVSSDQVLYGLTDAESAAGVTPVSYRYAPGNILRYGAVGDGTTDCSTALQAAINQACEGTSLDKAPVYVPASLNLYKLTTGAVAPVGIPFKIYGDGGYYSCFITANDITCLTIQDVIQLSGVNIEHVGFRRASTSGSTKPAVDVINSAYTNFKDVFITGFSTGVRLKGGSNAPQSSFSCSFEDSVVAGHGSISIDAQSQSNSLTLRNVTFGASPIGLKCVDSIGLSIYGGDCESVTTAGVDLDSTVDTSVSAIISGVDFEACAATGGVIRIGNTATTRDVVVVGNNFNNAGSSQYYINPVRCVGLFARGNTSTTGTASGFAVRPSGTTQQMFDVKFNGWQFERTTLTYSASMTPDAGVCDDYIVTITNNTAFTLNAPTGCAVPGQRLNIWFSNTSGGAHGAGTISAYKNSGAFPAIANGNRRRFEFEYDGTNWYETFRSAADVAN